MLEGTLKFFDLKKLFGFLARTEGQDVFCDGHGLCRFIDWGGMEPDRERTDLLPEDGEKIFFSLDKADSRPRALWWASATSWERACEAISKRPLHRLVRRRGFVKTRLESEIQERWETLWKGRNLKELRNRFPRRKWPCVHEQYLGVYVQIETDKEQWKEVEDPR